MIWKTKKIGLNKISMGKHQQELHACSKSHLQDLCNDCNIMFATTGTKNALIEKLALFKKSDVSSSLNVGDFLAAVRRGIMEGSDCDEEKQVLKSMSYKDLLEMVNTKNMFPPCNATKGDLVKLLLIYRTPKSVRTKAMKAILKSVSLGCAIEKGSLYPSIGSRARSLTSEQCQTLVDFFGPTGGSDLYTVGDHGVAEAKDTAADWCCSSYSSSPRSAYLVPE
jgi:hypothetical protein